jgi:nucleoside-diphosphate-sugar epimerase
MRKLVFGCGYLGYRVATRWKQEGHDVAIVTRNPAKATQLRQEGFQTLIADILDRRSLEPLPPAETVLFAVGYDRKAGVAPQPSIQSVYADGLRNVTEAIDPAVTTKFVYISSTGVYGTGKGDEIDEASPCHPNREGGKACLAAENVLTSSPVAGQAIILRLAGIYGPDRIPRAADLQSGKPVDVDPDSWLNLIHVDDAATIVLAADAKVRPPFLCVVSDGVPVRRGDYYAELAQLLGAPAPTFVSPSSAIDSGVRGRTGGDKRIRPDRLFRELSPVITYGDFRAGLASIVRKTTDSP